MREISVRKTILFRQLLLCFTLVLFIPVLISTVGFTSAVNALEAETRQNVQVMLDIAMQAIDNTIVQARQVAVNIANHRLTTYYFQYTRDTPDTIWKYPYSNYEFVSELQAQRATNRYLHELLVYSAYDDSLATSGTRFKLADTYGSYFQYGNWSYDEFKENLLKDKHAGVLMPAVTVTIFGQRYRTIPFVLSRDLGVQGADGQVLLLLREEAIDQIIDSLIHEARCSVWLQDQAGAVLYEKTSDQAGYTLTQTYAAQDGMLRTADETIYVAFCESSTTGCHFTYAVPSELGFQTVHRIRVTVLSLTAVSLVFGIIVSIFLSGQNAKPVHETLKILSSIAPKPRGRHEMEHIDTYLRQLISDNTLLLKRQEEQKPVLRGMLIRHLLMGEIYSDEEVNRYIRRAEMEMGADQYCVVLVELNELEGSAGTAIAQAELAFQGLLGLNQNIQWLFHALTDQRFAWIAMVKQADKEAPLDQIRAICQTVSERLTSLLPVLCVISVGNTYPRLTDIRRSYEDARNALSRQRAPERQVIVYGDTVGLNREMFFPSHIRAELLRLLDAGDRENVSILLQHVYEQNFPKGDLLAPEAYNELLREINDTLRRYCQQKDRYVEMKAEIDAIEGSDLLHVWTRIYAIIDKLLKLNAMESNEKTEEFIARIHEYIDRHFANQNLSVSDIAEHFNMNANYLSYSYKNKTKESLFTQIERRRIKMACELLRTGHVPIKDIAQKAGYSSDQVFRRAFKRVMNTSPSLYQKSLTDVE